MPATSLLTKAFQFDVMEDRALFMSDTFITYLKNTLASMTGSKVYVLQVVWEPDNDDIAHTDGRMVFLNVGHPYVRHFKKQKMRFIYVMHMLFHEIGHLLDADLIKDYQKVLGKIATRERFYQGPQVLSNEEHEAEAALKNPLLTNIFVSLAQCAYNCGLDTHDETAMANNYSAYVQQSFAVGLQVDMANMPTLRQMRASEESEVSVITALMFQYIRFGHLIMDDTEESWNDPAVKFVMEYKSSLDELRFADDPFVRQLALFRVLAAIWSMIRDQLNIPPVLPPMQSPPSEGGDNSQEGQQSSDQSESKESKRKDGSSGSASSRSDGQEQNSSASEAQGQSNSASGESRPGEKGQNASESGSAQSSQKRNGSETQGAEGETKNGNPSDPQEQDASGADSSGSESQSSNSKSSGVESRNDGPSGHNTSGSESSQGGNQKRNEGTDASDDKKTESPSSDSKNEKNQDRSSESNAGTQNKAATSQKSGETGRSASPTFPSAQELEEVLAQIKEVGDRFRSTVPQNIDGKSLKVGSDRKPIRQTDMGAKATEALAGQIEASMTQAILDTNKDAETRTESDQEVANIISTQNANSSHTGIPVNVIRPAASMESVRDPYNRIYSGVSGYADRAAQEVKQMFEEIREGTTLRSRRTGRVDSRGLGRIATNQRIFFTKKAPSDEDDMAICLLIDQSASMSKANEGMSRSKIAYARDAAIMLEAFARKTNIPLFICGHSMTCGAMNFFVHKSFESTSEIDRYALAAISSGGCNRDGYAIYIACEMLAKRPENDKLFIMLSDGLPNDSSYGGEEAAEDIRSIVNLAQRKHGIETIAAAIGDDKERIKAIYGNSYLDVTDLATLPKTLTRLIRERIE